MSSPLLSLLFLCLLFTFSSSSSPSPTTTTLPSCKDSSPNPTCQYNACIDLPVLGASLYWTYDPNSGTARIAFRVTGVTQSNWVSWGLNPTGSGMVGAQTLVAYQTSNGLVRAYTSSIGSYRTRLPETRLSFPVSEISAEIRSESNEMVIFSTLQLPPNKTLVNHVWQVGPMAGGQDVPLPHSMQGDSLEAFGTVDFLSGAARPARGLSRRDIVKYVHGVLCTVGFGVLMPFGVLMARYKDLLDSGAPALWFKIHRGCQGSAYVIGMIGFILGLVVGPKSHLGPHMIIGIVIGVCSSLQVLTVCLRPDKGDKFRPLWNGWHYLLGYGALGLSAANIFLGLGLLGQAPSWWKKSYMAYLIIFGSVWVLSFPLNLLQNKKRKNASESHSKNTIEIVEARG